MDALRWSVAAVHCSAGGAHPLDDSWGTAYDLAWVIDGATDLDGPVLFPGAPGNAAWLSQQLSTALGSGRVGADGPQRLADAIAAVDEAATTLGVAEVVDFPTAVAVLARRCDDRSVEVTVIGDAFALVEVKSSAGPRIELVSDPAWPTGCGPAAAGTGAVAPSPARAPADVPWSELSAEELQEKHLVIRRRRNTDAGRWVVRREPAAAEHAYTHVVHDTTGRIVLLSDGAERALRRPGVDERSLFDAGFEGATAFVESLRAWEDTRPPELPAWWTRHDDVTLLALTMRS